MNNEEKDPQFILLSEKNKDEFLVWCLTKLWEDNLKLDDEVLNYYMEIKTQEWIDSNEPWLYCYTSIIDEFTSQKKSDKEKQEKIEKEEIRPTDIQKRRELFANKFENKFKNSKFNIKK